MSQKRSNSVQRFNRKLKKAIKQLINELKTLLQKQGKWLLRCLLITKKIPQISLSLIKNLSKEIKQILGKLFFSTPKTSLYKSKGFILPTIAIVLLVFALVVGSIIFRSADRTEQVVDERSQQVVTNAATPALQRAKAKLAFLFSGDDRYPNSLPSGEVIQSILLNDGSNGVTQKSDPEFSYTLNDETRIDINGDGTLDNAWTFQSDTDGDRVPETVAYSILALATKLDSNGNKIADRSDTNAIKSQNLVVRNGPISLKQTSNAQCNLIANSQNGWDATQSSSLFVRAFQVTTVAIKKNNENDFTYTASELEQDRKASLGNKWGAWFLNDLEIFPGPNFRWNGAMHTEGNLIVSNNGSNTLRFYLISDPDSCLYNRENSEVTLAEFPTANAETGQPIFFGRAIAGRVKNNDFNGESQWDIYGDNGPLSTYTLNRNTDEVENNPNPATRILDAVTLYTEGIRESRNTSDIQNTQNLDPNWNSQAPATEKRIYNKAEIPPFVDDTYRADNLYGPKPQYTNSIDIPSGKKAGDEITTSDPNYQELVSNDISPQTIDNVGYDGYWERRAWAEGLRVIVGQRLELGDRYGWKGNSDALYPPEPNSNACTTNDRCHEHRQFKTLLDNLAAVQSTAVYTNYKEDIDPTRREFPVACIATVAHPGTQQTITDSTTFNYYPGTNSTDYIVDTNFFEGKGTNGWEFNSPADFTSEAEFANAINNNTPLKRALTNLAYFAGDPEGAFPAKQETSGSMVHPYPYTMMWGDFSNLRRVIDKLDANTADYLTFDPSNPNPSNDLSLADKTTLQTASCTLGMLAYNLDNIENNQGLESNQGFLNEINNKLASEFGSDTLPTSNIIQTYKSRIGADLVDRIELIEQVSRDRLLGFKDSDPSVIPANKQNYTLSQVSNFSYGGNPTPYNSGDTLSNLGFDFSSDTGNNYFGIGLPDTPQKEQQFIRLALLVRDIINDGSDEITKPKYPALFYLFPKIDHDYNGNTSIPANTYPDPSTNQDGGNQETQFDGTTPINEEYVVNIGSSDSNKIRQKNGTDYRYQPINLNPNDFSDLKITPRKLTAGADSWQFQCSVNGTSPQIDCDQNASINNSGINRITDPNGDPKYVALLDKGMFNGREMMSVRNIDMDLNILRHNKTADMVENWLPDSAVIYAFREDARREEAIQRPSATTWSNCDTYAKITSNTACEMNAIGSSPQDPPLEDQTGISPKAVDGYADPDRRPYGFRLRNGQDLRRCHDGKENEILAGLSFITDNPAYIVSDNSVFNAHVAVNGTGCEYNDSYYTNNGNRIEEFNQILNDNFSNFYGRSGLNVNFARAGDVWRPAEILADAVSILSDDFIDGSIAEGITRSDVNGRSSYRAMNAPNDSTPGSNGWLREDGTTSNSNNGIPIQISRNGYPQFNSSGTEYGNGGNTNKYLQFDQNKSLIPVNNAKRVNAVIVSGLVPSRIQQSYGGLHNFPRFLENWNRDLFISGAFLQLNFSASATAPFDQDSWEPGDPARNPELIKYYGPPGRKWGYDVGLQYAPAGPIALRFVTPSGTVSEFFRQLPLDDEYVINLRCGEDSNGNKVDPNVDSNSCPN